MKYKISKDYMYDSYNESDKVNLSKDISKIRYDSESPREFYDNLILYFSDRPIVVKELDKSIKKLASEITGISILKIIAKESNRLMKVILKNPGIISKFGVEVDKMATKDMLDIHKLKLAISNKGDVYIGEDVTNLEMLLGDSGYDSSTKERSGFTEVKYTYTNKNIKLDDVPGVSIKDIDLHLEGES
ncbi:hypothetical protein CMI47_16540 [Candidatus Pacearchaeota archaeon]|jgi:hypothetical protein|nr:hypothetical protein [Candidatus Pacearchaeota archaeon]|tara:strand:- start:6774 stop:7337 length:564 start_codon:yes stop_codon:yes gene_type:complete